MVATTPSTLAALIQPVVKLEGGYTNDPNDAGGETNFGITIAVARAYGYTGSMASMPLDIAVAIYTKQWIVPYGIDGVFSISPKIAFLLFELNVNLGQTIAGRFLQRALNVLNLQGKLFPDLVVDGVCMLKTQAAMQTLFKSRGADGETVLLGMVRGQASVRYIEIAEGKPTDELYEFGWQLNRVIGT